MIVIEELESDCLKIALDIIIVTDEFELTETINAKDNANEIMNNITSIIEEFGYMKVREPHPSDSGSLYFTFCDADEFNAEEVKLIIGMRVADHILPKWDKTETTQDAKIRQLNHLKAQTKEFNWMNKNLRNDEEIPVDFIYVKYENEYYSNVEEVYDKVRKKLREFRNKHK